MHWPTFSVVAFLAVGAMGITGGGWGGAVVSRRSEEFTNSNVYQLVADILAKAKSPEGITAADLEDAVGDLMKATGTILGPHKVSAEDTKAVIDNIAKDFKCATAVLPLFDEPMIYEASSLDGALCLLGGLVARAKSLENSRTLYPVLAAIIMTAEEIETIVQDSVAVVMYATPDMEKVSPIMVRDAPDLDDHGACNGGFTSFRGSCYAYINSQKAWEQAQSVCRALGGYLVEIFTSKENEFVEKMATSNGGHEIWLGASDKEKPGDWFWANSGRSFSSFGDWAPGQPDKNHENCLEMIFVHHSRGHWNDDHCGQKQRFICQKNQET